MSLIILPVEVLEKITTGLAVEDLTSLAQVCKRLTVVQDLDNVWYSAFTKR